MYSYRFKIPTFLLGCLLVTSLFNVISSQRLRGRIDRFPAPSTVVVASPEAFAARLATVSDPAELRTIAMEQHRVALAADQVLGSLPGFFKALGRSLFIQSWGVLALAVCFYLFEYRLPPR